MLYEKKCILLFFKLKKKCQKTNEISYKQKGGIFPLFFRHETLYCIDALSSGISSRMQLP